MTVDRSSSADGLHAATSMEHLLQYQEILGFGLDHAYRFQRRAAGARVHVLVISALIALGCVQRCPSNSIHSFGVHLSQRMGVLRLILCCNVQPGPSVEHLAERQRMEEAAMPLMLDAMWAANVLDIEGTLRSVCRKVSPEM